MQRLLSKGSHRDDVYGSLRHRGMRSGKLFPQCFLQSKKASSTDSERFERVT